MKNIALFAVILAVGILASACINRENEVAIRSNVEVTLSDGAIVSCAEGGWLLLYSGFVNNKALEKLSCTNVKGLHVSIPANKVVKIEIRAPKK